MMRHVVDLIKSTPWKHVGGLAVWLYSFLTSALDGSKWLSSRPGSFTPRWKNPGTHRTGVWVGPQSCVEVYGKREKSHTPAGIWTPDRPAHSLCTLHLNHKRQVKKQPRKLTSRWEVNTVTEMWWYRTGLYSLRMRCNRRLELPNGPFQCPNCQDDSVSPN
jgi:hypothetical protein